MAGAIKPEELDTRLGVEELRAIGASLGHGNVIAFSDDTTIGELLHEIMEFAAYESCGKCFPCRLGTQRLVEILSKGLERGRLSADEAEELERVSRVMRAASLCGHGTSVGDAMLVYMEKYRDEVVG